MDSMWQSTCLVVNPISVYSYGLNTRRLSESERGQLRSSGRERGSFVDERERDRERERERERERVGAVTLLGERERERERGRRC